MAVAKKKDKERGKPTKREQRKNVRTKVRHSGEKRTPPFLASPNLHRAGSGEREKCIKRGRQDGLRPLLWGWPALTP